MTDLNRIIDKYQWYAKKYGYQNSARILTLEDKKIVIKTCHKNKKELFDYLDSREFPYYLKPLVLEEDDRYEAYPYIEDKVLLKEEKAIDMMYVLSLLHNKTSFYREIDLDSIKEIYESVSERIHYLYYYYHDLQDNLEKRVYMAPDEYLLMRNMTLVYMALDYARETIEAWYEQISKDKNIRYVLLHNQLDTSHFLDGDKAYLISWDQAKKDLPIYDFLGFFKREYQSLDMNSLFQLYQHKYPFTYTERLLFMALIALPNKLMLSINNYNKYSEVYSFVTYLNKSREFILKQDKRYQETNKQK